MIECSALDISIATRLIAMSATLTIVMEAVASFLKNSIELTSLVLRMDAVEIA